MRPWIGLTVVALLVGACGHPAEPETGPVFHGTVTVGGQLAAGAIVQGTANDCDSKVRIADGTAKTSSLGVYRLTLPMKVGTSNLCIQLVAVGSTAEVDFMGLRYEEEGQTHTADLDDAHRRVVVFRPGEGG